MALHKAGVPASVLRAMTATAQATTGASTTVGGRGTGTSGAGGTVSGPATPAAPAADGAKPSAVSARRTPPDRDPPGEPGIYMWHATDGGYRFTLLEPNAFTQTKTGGWVKTSLTYGIARSKTKAVLNGANASLYTVDPNVVFYFVFEKKSAGLSDAGPGTTTSSPNEFTLLRLQVTRKSREMVIGSMNAYGASAGVDEERVVPFTTTRLRPGVYRVAPNAPLTLGEYAFTSTAAGVVFAPGFLAKDRVFDFGVAERQ